MLVICCSQEDPLTPSVSHNPQTHAPVQPVKQELISIDFDDESSDSPQVDNDCPTASSDHGDGIAMPVPCNNEEEMKENSDPWEIGSDDFDDLIDDEALMILEDDVDEVDLITEDSVLIEEEQETTSLKTLQEIANEADKDVYDPTVLGTRHTHTPPYVIYYCIRLSCTYS